MEWSKRQQETAMLKYMELVLDTHREDRETDYTQEMTH